MLAVPSDGLCEALGEVRARGLPAELAAELGRVDGVAAVVAGAVAHPVEVVGLAAESGEDGPEHVDVRPLSVGPDEVRLADAAAGEDRPDRARVVLGVDPVADVQAVSVELRPHAVDEVRYLPGDELLHVLVGPVVVRAVGDRSAHAEGAGPGAHEHVRGGLG